jgi:hypothetical protein
MGTAPVTAARGYRRRGGVLLLVLVGWLAVMTGAGALVGHGGALVAVGVPLALAGALGLYSAFAAALHEDDMILPMLSAIVASAAMARIAERGLELHYGRLVEAIVVAVRCTPVSGVCREDQRLSATATEHDLGWLPCGAGDTCAPGAHVLVRVDPAGWFRPLAADWHWPVGWSIAGITAVAVTLAWLCYVTVFAHVPGSGPRYR